MSRYDHSEIEKKWQEAWAKQKLYETPDSASGKKNFYALVEFPYPSGDLHVGHWYAFAIPDIFARMKRMQGANVLYPIGFDAFGLPAENAAIKNKVDPKEWTLKNIERMRGQLRSMGNSFDWSREVVACDPAYYRWTQSLFLKLYEKGLAYRGKALVNWDPVDKTVLANEQVLPDGTAERSGAKVEKKELEQWFLKITNYADRLLKDLETLDWPEPIKEAQRNWIGKSEGAEIDFPLKIADGIKRFVILHGKGGSPKACYIPWLKGELEARGYEVEVPELPNPEAPNDDEQADYVLKNCTFDEKTAIVTQSFGGVVALRLLERGVKVARVTLAACPVSGEFLDKKERPTVTAACKKGFDFGKIRKQAKEFVVLADAGDDVVPLSDAEVLSKELSGTLVRGRGNTGHFGGEKEPDVLMAATPTIRVFTTRADTLYGGTFLVLAPEHPLVDSMIYHTTNSEEVVRYREEAKTKTEIDRTAEGKEKTGVELKGVMAVNPATKEEIPVWVADYVLGGYGHGAIMAVPAHDDRDLQFALKFNLRIKPVVAQVDSSSEFIPGLAEAKIASIKDSGFAHMGDGLLFNSGQFNGLPNQEAKQKIADFVGGRMTNTYRLRDWLISRQRYWGVPIPIVYDPEGKAHPIPEEHLPWLLPTDVDFTPTGEAPLARSKELKERTEKIFGKGWRPEIDTMDTFVDSSWYFLRYLDPKNEKEFSSLEKQKAWMPINRYSGGAEHTTMHLLYSRFYYKALHDLGLVTEDEPYKVRLNRGIILAEDGRKMSKRWGNVVNPDEQVANVGADAVRTYLAFIGPYNEVGSYPWSTNGLVGVRRFLERVTALSEKISDTEPHADLEILLNQSVKKVTDDIESMRFNTAVSQLMILSNELQKLTAVPRKTYETLLVLLAPFAPHLTEDLWHGLGHKNSIHLESWPSYDSGKLTTDTITVAIQIAGKTRGTVSVPRAASESEVIEGAKSDERLKKLIPESPSRVIYVPGRILNFIP